MVRQVIAAPVSQYVAKFFFSAVIGPLRQCGDYPGNIFVREINTVGINWHRIPAGVRICECDGSAVRSRVFGISLAAASR